MKRPLVLAGSLYVAGILIGDHVEIAWQVLLGGAFVLVAAALAWSRARPRLLLPLLFIAGWTNLALHTTILSPRDLRLVLGDQPTIIAARGKLCETPTLRIYEHNAEPAWRTMARLEVSAICPNRGAWQPAHGRIAVTTPGELTNYFGGQTVEINGVARLPNIAVAEGTFDYRAYLKLQGIYYQLQMSSEQDWRALTPAAPPLADRFRAWAKQALAIGLPVEDESLRLEWALTLGWKTALTEEVSEPFIRAATYHIFAVDGLRMAIIFGIGFGLLRALGIPRAICGLLLLPLIWFYVALTGWPASAIRASVMLTVVIFGWALKRPTDLLNSLFAAALIILIWQPHQLFQAGFQMSFLVVLCIILVLPPLRNLGHRMAAPDPMLPKALLPRWRKVVAVPGRFVGDLFLTSLAAWLGSLPLVAYYFHIVTPVSTPANVIAVPLCALALMSNLASLLFASWFPAAAGLFNQTGWFVMECIRVSSNWFANWPAAYAYVPAPSLFTSVLFYAVLLTTITGWLFAARFRTAKVSVFALLVAAWGIVCWHQAGVHQLTVLPVNGGVAVYCDVPGGAGDLLVDCGNSNAVQLVAQPFLRAQGVNRLPNLLLTHGDLRHVGGAQCIADSFAVEHVCVSPLRFRSPAYRRLMQAFNQQPQRVHTLCQDDQIGELTVLHPQATDRFPQADDNALVLAGRFRGTRVLLLSDLGRPGQNALLERTDDLRSDIVVTGLATASEALSDPLLDAVKPQVIIVADSEFPATERASAKLRERLGQRNIPILYTRFTGAATIEMRENRWSIRTMNGVHLTGKPSGGSGRAEAASSSASP